MKKPKLLSITLVAVLFAVAWFVCWQQGAPWTLMDEGDIDISSGDHRYRVYVCCIPVKSEIWESLLSHEVRRLAIGVPAKREWKSMGRHCGGVHRDSAYGFMTGACDRLVDILDRTNTPDDERRAVLEKLMTMLRTEEPDRVKEEGYLLTVEIADKHNLHIFTPEFEDHYRRLRNQRQVQTPTP